MLAGADAQTNMVRTTIAAFAAGVGGADSVVTLPHTLARGGADADARRIARNTQAIVLEETNAYRVADPAAGAGAIEQLTEGLAARAWDIFREIERDGGMLKALTIGTWQERIAKTRETRAKTIATRKVPIIGVSHFPKAEEALAATPAEARPSADGAPLPADADFPAMVEAFLGGASLGPAPTGDGAITATPLAPARLAEPFEALRADNEAREPRPTAFLALVGPIARHGARAGFIRNLLEAGGILVVDGPVEAEASAVAEAYKQSGATVAVVCGADPDYAEGGAAVAKALAGARRDGLAGGPTQGWAGRTRTGRRHRVSWRRATTRSKSSRRRRTPKEAHDERDPSRFLQDRLEAARTWPSRRLCPSPGPRPRASTWRRSTVRRTLRA